MNVEEPTPDVENWINIIDINFSINSFSKTTNIPPPALQICAANPQTPVSDFDKNE